MRIEHKISTQVLVVGGGGAALRAALAAREAGAEVCLLTKGIAGKGGATYHSVAEIGAYNVPSGAIDPTDSPEFYYEDMMAAALGAADEKLARILAEEAEDSKTYLEACGMRYAKNEDGSYKGYRACFSKKARSHVVENHFKPIVSALGTRARQAGIHILEHMTATNLILRDGVCAGVFALGENGLCCILASAVVLAVGGGSKLFDHNMYPADITGDGYAMAYRAGARMANMEFIQAGIGLAWPEVNLFGNQLWEAMPRLTNAEGERFLARYTDGICTEAEAVAAKGGHFPFSSRDISRYVEIAIQKERLQGTASTRGNLYLDFQETDFHRLFADESSKLKGIWPLTYERFRSFGIDLYQDKLEIACFAHAINGGVWIDEEAQSSVPGLYAAGEVAAGPHGADRLGGNMSVTCQVFGKRAGEAAARRANNVRPLKEADAEAVRECAFLEELGRAGEDEIETLQRKIQACADDTLLIVRNEDGLCRCQKEIQALRKCMKTGIATKSASLEKKLELENLLLTAELIANAALLRRESRGSHYRSDFPHVIETLAHPIFLARAQQSGE